MPRRTDAARQPARHGFVAQSLTVAGVTLANGGDNLGVYIPLIGDRIRRHGHVLLPVVLIALGLYILSGAFE